jgi:hypothetical protein
MKFNDVILPEIIEGKRGPDLWIKFYKHFLDSISFDSTGISISPIMSSIDKIQINSFVTIKICQKVGYKIYHVGKGFLDVLSNLNRDIPVDLLPKHFSGYINFPKGALGDDIGHVQGGFVFIGKDNYRFKSNDSDKDEIYFSATYVNENFVTGSFFSKFNKNTFNEVLEQYDMVEFGYNNKPPEILADENIKKQRNRIWKTLINCILYIHSEDPKIERIAPYSSIKKHVSKNQVKKENGILNECTMPIIFIHRLYQHPKIYTVDKTWIETFPRWQRCGPEFKNVKLIWVKEHIRNYKNKEGK